MATRTTPSPSFIEKTMVRLEQFEEKEEKGAFITTNRYRDIESSWKASLKRQSDQDKKRALEEMKTRFQVQDQP